MNILMKQSKLKQIRLGSKLIVKTKEGVKSVEVTRIIAKYNRENTNAWRIENKQFTADVDSIAIEQFKIGLATVEIDHNDWLVYCNILQSESQPSLFRFFYDKLKSYRFSLLPFPI